MDEKTPIDAAQVRAAAYLAAKQRLDFRAGKTRALVQCNPPNIKCGNRCIPPEWDCRLKGQGNDPHLAAKRTDPVSGIANIERGIKRLGRFARTGSFSELESSKRSFVRGAVKLKPGTLKEKGEFKEWIENNWSKVVIPVSVVAGGLALHSGLKATDFLGYRKGAGAKIDDAVAQGIGAVLDRTPVVGQARAYTRSRAASAEAGNLSRIAGRAQRNRSYAANPESGIPATTIPRSWVAGSSDLSAALKVVDNQGSSNTFYEWNTKHRTAFWGATHKDGTSVFAVPTAHAFMNTEWNLNLSPTTVRADYVNAITGRIISDRDAFLQLAKQQGFKVLGRPGAQYIDSNQRDAFVSRSTRAITNERQRAAHAKYVDTVVRNLAPSSAARDIYEGHVEFFDKYYKDQSASLIKVAGAPDFDGPRDIREQFEKNVIAEQPGLLELRKAMERRRIDYLMQTSTKPNTVSKGAEHDALFLRDYYHTKVAGKGKSPYTITDRLAVQAASELSGKQQLTPAQAIQLLKTEYGFTSAEIEIRPGPQRRKPQPRTPAPAGDRPARRRTPAQAIASMMRQKNPDGTPRYATREAAEAAYKRAQEGRTDSEASLHFTPRVEAYLQTVARLDKRCGKSGIPENAKCSKPTTAQSREAAQRAKGAAEPGITCAPGTQQCGKICIPQSATCHIKAGGSGLDKAAKVAAIAGGVASVVGVVRNRKAIVRTAKQGKLQVRRSLRTNNREAYRQTAVRARAARRVVSNTARTQTQQTIAELSKRTIKTLSTADVDAGIGRLPKNFQDPVRRLVGDAKLSAAHIALKSKGGRITSVNNTDNFSNWEMQDGTLLSTGSVGETLIIYNTKPQDSIGGARTYSTQFRVDGEFDAKSPAASRNAKGVASTVKKMFQSQMEQIPDNSIITAIPYANDNKGKKRRSIYERYGFRQALSSDERLFAMKRKGQFTKMQDSHIEQIADLIRNDDLDLHEFRADKRCGQSAIPDNYKCTKTTSAKPSTNATAPEQKPNLNTAKVVAGALTITGGAAAIALLGAKRAKISAYRKNVAKSAIEAEKLAVEMERQFREQAARRLNKKPNEVTDFEASVYNFKDKGQDRGFSSNDTAPAWYGQTPNSKGAVVMLSYADDNKFTHRGQGSYMLAKAKAFSQIWGDRDILPYANNISQPTTSVPDDLVVREREAFVRSAEKVGAAIGLGEQAKGAAKAIHSVKDIQSRFKYLRKNVDERGFNPDAVRAAAFVVAQRRLTGKPVDILSYSNGGNVASETLAILHDMGYRDVKVVNVAGPTFGMFSHDDDNMRTWVSKGDDFYKISGGAAFTGGNTRILNNDNIPHGLTEKIDKNNREYGANWKQNLAEGNSYLYDKQLQREAWSYLNVDRKRSGELVNELVWRVSENKPMEGDLNTLFGDNAASKMKEYTAALKSPTQREAAKARIRSEIEDRMVETWYGGYDANRVKNAQKQIRKDLEQQVSPSDKETKKSDRMDVYTSTYQLQRVRLLAA